MQLRQRDAQVGVPFVRADDEAARFGDGEVHAGDSGFGAQEFRAQMLAGRFGQVIGVGRAGLGAEPFVKQLADFFFADVNRRRHDVARMLSQQLHDPFAQVGVGHFDAKLLQGAD